MIYNDSPIQKAGLAAQGRHPAAAVGGLGVPRRHRQAAAGAPRRVHAQFGSSGMWRLGLWGLKIMVENHGLLALNN